jgi:predicted  nucleic acid-binding Zn-ribbon protein
MSAALGLLRLQQVDSKIDQLEDKLEHIRVELENDVEVAGARQALEAADAARQEAERDRMAVEMQAHSQRSKLQQAESTLYGGSVRNPKELQDLQADVASLGRHLSALEDAELECMEKLEATETLYRAMHERLDQVLSRTQDDRGRLMDQQSDLLHSRGSLKAERAAAESAVDSQSLETYKSLRRTHRGIAVAEVSDNACGACGTALTAALQQSARHATEIVRCPSCGRVLYG